MSAVDNQPDNPNPLNPINFRFNLLRAPSLTFFCQSATIPTINIGEPPVENFFVKIPTPGDKLVYSPLTLRFQVDENLTDWREIHDWMVGLGFPEDFSQSIHRSPSDVLTNISNNGIYSDATLTIMTSSRNPNVRVLFKDMYPISLSPLQFDTTQQDVTYLEADVDFNYRTFTIETV